MRELRRLQVPPGHDGVLAVLRALPAALDGSGPAIAPVPVTGPAMPTAYVQRMLDATRPDGPPLERDDAALVLSTSGSTGTPRGVLLSAGNLLALAAELGGDAATTWIAAIPVTSAGGMNVVVRAQARGARVIGLPSLGGGAPFAPGDFADAVESADGTDVRTSLVAAQVRRLLADERGAAALAACSVVLVGGGPLDPATRSRAEERGVRVHATYGATETAGGCVIDGRPASGVGIAIDDGEVIVSGPVVALGYRLDPDATRARFADGAFRTGDLGSLAADGTLVVTGRRDDQVTVRGSNVSLLAVESVLLGTVGVAGGAVVAVPDPAAPDEAAIVAFAVPAPGSAGARLREAVADAVRAQLGPPAVPRAVVAVETVPALPNGKPDRVALRADAARILG